MTPSIPPIATPPIEPPAACRIGAVRCSAVSIEGLLTLFRQWAALDARRPHIVLCVNAHIYNLAARYPDLCDILESADIVAPDGMSIVWMARLLRLPIQARCNMTDAFHAFLAETFPSSQAVLVGCSEDISSRAADAVGRLSSHCAVRGTVSGYLPLARYGEALEPYRDVDYVFLGMGTPRSERVARIAAQTCSRAVIWHIGGGTFNCLAGVRTDAPAWMKRVGLQWLHRFLQEPGRLWRRYVIGNPLFLVRVLRDTLRPPPADATPADAPPPRVNVLGVGVHALDMRQAVRLIARSLHPRAPAYITCTSVHGVIESQHDESLRSIHNRSFLTLPDGMPTVWTGHGEGYPRMGRVYGPDLMREVLAATCGRDHTGQDPTPAHFFYGSTPETLARLTANLRDRFPDIRIAGVHAPPFRPLEEEEWPQEIERIRSSGAACVWVGLSTPKQERFMAEFVRRGSTVPVMLIGVGAAFDIHAGIHKDAPEWMKRSGLQWVHRLCQEPGRLWRRYLTIVPAFLWLMTLQKLGLRRLPLPRPPVP